MKNIYFNGVAKGFNIFNGTISIVMVLLGLVIMVASIQRWVVLWRARGNSEPIELLS